MSIRNRGLKALSFIFKSRVKMILEAVLSEQTFQRLYSRPDDFTRKAIAHKKLKEAIRELKAGAHKHSIADSKSYESLGISDLEGLNEEQLLALAKLRYEGSEHVDKDVKLAVEAWKVAARLGNIEATYSLGVCFRDGVGVEKDEVEAFRLLLPLADDYNNPYAHYSCGIMRMNGEGTEVDTKAAFKHFQIAARMGIPPAAYNMANMYATGQGTPQNNENAFICYEIAADAGDIMAKYILGQWMIQGKGCENPDIPRGIGLLKECANAGNPRAAHNLGMIFLTGELVDTNAEDGIYWLTVAARLRFPQSIFNLAMIHKEGDYGQPVDLKKAEELLSKCCEMDPTNQVYAEYLLETRRLLVETGKSDKMQ